MLLNKWWLLRWNCEMETMSGTMRRSLTQLQNAVYQINVARFRNDLFTFEHFAIKRAWGPPEDVCSNENNNRQQYTHIYGDSKNRRLELRHVLVSTARPNAYECTFRTSGSRQWSRFHDGRRARGASANWKRAAKTRKLKENTLSCSSFDCANVSHKFYWKFATAQNDFYLTAFSFDHFPSD